jgi:hypothetical protein
MNNGQLIMPEPRPLSDARNACHVDEGLVRLWAEESLLTNAGSVIIRKNESWIGIIDKWIEVIKFLQFVPRQSSLVPLFWQSGIRVLNWLQTNE